MAPQELCARLPVSQPIGLDDHREACRPPFLGKEVRQFRIILHDQRLHAPKLGSLAQAPDPLRREQRKVRLMLTEVQPEVQKALLKAGTLEAASMHATVQEAIASTGAKRAS